MEFDDVDARLSDACDTLHEPHRRTDVVVFPDIKKSIVRNRLGMCQPKCTLQFHWFTPLLIVYGHILLNNV